MQNAQKGREGKVRGLFYIKLIAYRSDKRKVELSLMSGFVGCLHKPARQQGKIQRKCSQPPNRYRNVAPVYRPCSRAGLRKYSSSNKRKVELSLMSGFVGRDIDVAEVSLDLVHDLALFVA